MSGAGSRLVTPRCLHPVEYYELSRHPGQAPEAFPVCWKRAGHGGGHLSRAAYLRELDRALRRNKRRRQARRGQGLAA